MLSGFCKGTLQFFKFPLLPLSFSFSCIQTVQLFLAVAVFQFLLLLFFLPDTADGCEGILVTETSGHLIHLVSGFLGIGLGKFHVDTVCSYRSGSLLTAGESLHHKVYQCAQRNEYDQRKDILGLFEINLNHGLSLFLMDLTIFSSCRYLRMILKESSRLFTGMAIMESSS